MHIQLNPLHIYLGTFQYTEGFSGANGLLQDCKIILCFSTCIWILMICQSATFFLAFTTSPPMLQCSERQPEQASSPHTPPCLLFSGPQETSFPRHTRIFHNCPPLSRALLTCSREIPMLSLPRSSQANRPSSMATAAMSTARNDVIAFDKVSGKARSWMTSAPRWKTTYCPA